MILVSFDIDGTLEVGDPPGPIELSVVRRAKALGYIVGSASNRVRSDQSALWTTHEVDMDFVGHKHMLDRVREPMDKLRAGMSRVLEADESRDVLHLHSSLVAQLAEYVTGGHRTPSTAPTRTALTRTALPPIAR